MKTSVRKVVIASLILSILVIIPVAAEAYNYYNIPPFQRYWRALEINGKWSKTNLPSPHDQPAGGYLCPCEPCVGSNCPTSGTCTTKYGSGTVDEIKKANFYSSGAGQVSVSWTLTPYGYTQVNANGQSAYMDSYLQMYDNSGGFVGSLDLYHYTANSVATNRYWDGSTSYISTWNINVPAAGNYSIRWHFYITSSGTQAAGGQNDFYAPYWIQLSLFIRTP